MYSGLSTAGSTLALLAHPRERRYNGPRSIILISVGPFHRIECRLFSISASRTPPCHQTERPLTAPKIRRGRRAKLELQVSVGPFV
jgi:hypothetical protein